MNALQICIPFVVALLGIAFPIILQTISRLDEKYGSEICALFKNEPEYKYFRGVLYLSLIIILLYIILQISNQYFPSPIVNVFFSFIIFLIIEVVIILVICFTLLVNKMLQYYTIKELTSYLIALDSKRKDKTDFKIFIAISGLLYYSIKQQNLSISKTISQYVKDCLNNFRETHPNEVKGYPFVYYQVIVNTAKELLLVENNQLEFLESTTFGGSWLLGGQSTIKISERTYEYLWLILLLAIKAKRDDLVLKHWEYADQYFNYNIRPIREVLSSDNLILNESEIDARNEEREQFLEFHFALGGLLLYQRRYDCIRRLFQFTRSEPPNYFLLPTTMLEVFNKYFYFAYSFEAYYESINRKFPFPNIEGMQADNFIRNWICKYIVVLFFRQYTLIKYWMTQEYTAIPNLPTQQGERGKWIQNIKYFKKLVVIIMNDNVLMKEIGFDVYDFFSERWCENNHKQYPIELLDEIISKLNIDFKETEVSQKPSHEKIKLFRNTTKEIITEFFSEINPIINNETIDYYYNPYYCSGSQFILDKASFCEGQVATNMNFDSFPAYEFIKENRFFISQLFFLLKTKSYLLDINDLFKGIDKLEISAEDYIIISFGIDTSYFKDYVDVKLLSDSCYKDISIFNFSPYSSPLVSQSLFVLKKSDRPFIIHNQINPEEIDKYKLDQLDKELQLYASIVDLNIENLISEEFREAHPDTEFQKYVLAVIAKNTEIRWKKKIELIQLSLHSQYEEKGLPNSLNDIISLKMNKDKGD